MSITKKTVLAMAALMAAAAGSVHASTVSYFIDQTNSANLSDGINYAQVTISDEGVAGNIDFTVEVLEAGFIAAGANPGSKLTMKTFSFNFNALLAVDTTNIANFVPGDWTVKKTDANAGGGFGFFDFELADGSNNTPTMALSFSIVGVDGDTIEDYAVGYTSASDPYFATHISGYDINGETSAKFATVVPVPAAAWLFGSGLIGLVSIARRRAS